MHAQVGRSEPPPGRGPAAASVRPVRLTISDLVLGAAAGAVGTLAMDGLWFRRAKAEGNEDRFAEWELASGSDFESFQDAPAPAQVGRRIAGTLGVDLPVERAGLAADVVHWSTGAGWGAVAGALAGTTRLGAVPAGVTAGIGAVSTAYGALGAMGIYKPVREYDADTLWQDVSAHLVFGAATGMALAALRSAFRR